MTELQRWPLIWTISDVVITVKLSETHYEPDRSWAKLRHQKRCWYGLDGIASYEFLLGNIERQDLQGRFRLRKLYIAKPLQGKPSATDWQAKTTAMPNLQYKEDNLWPTKHSTPLLTDELSIDTMPFIQFHWRLLSSTDIQVSSRQLIQRRIYTLVITWHKPRNKENFVRIEPKLYGIITVPTPPMACAPHVHQEIKYNDFLKLM